MKIGIFGGCFNPPHNMHKKIAKDLIEKGYLDKVIYVPTGNKYQKKDLVDAKMRYEMLELMIEDEKDLLVSNYEMKNTLTYTYQTLSHFKNKYPSDEIYFICGMDNLLELTSWRNYQEILNQYKILVIERGKSNKDNLYHHENVIYVEIKASELSSTKVRNLIQNNKIEELERQISFPVLEYIKKEKLYRK